MSRTALLHPAAYPSAIKVRADWISHASKKAHANWPAISDACLAQALDLIKLADDAMQNDVRGTNVVPHLLDSLEAIAAELERLP